MSRHVRVSSHDERDLFFFSVDDTGITKEGTNGNSTREAATLLFRESCQISTRGTVWNLDNNRCPQLQATVSRINYKR